MKKKFSVPKTVKLAQEVVASIRQHLPEVHVLLYHSTAYDSVYLKFDYGVGNSLRIADHSSKKEHLDYRYNVLLDAVGMTQKKGEKYIKYFYGPEQKSIADLAYAIAANIQEKKRRFGEERYKYFMDINSCRLPAGWADKAVEM